MGYDHDLQLFECRLLKSKAMFRVSIDKLRAFDEHEDVRDPRDGMTLKEGEIVKIDEEGTVFREKC